MWGLQQQIKELKAEVARLTDENKRLQIDRLNLMSKLAFEESKDRDSRTS